MRFLSLAVLALALACLQPVSAVEWPILSWLRRKFRRSPLPPPPPKPECDRPEWKEKVSSSNGRPQVSSRCHLEEVQYKGPNGSWLPGWARAAFWIDNSETVPVRHTFLELVVGEGAVIELDPWSVALVKPSTRELLAKTLGEDSLYMIRGPRFKRAAQADLLPS
jgi:hypothetical protein